MPHAVRSTFVSAMIIAYTWIALAHVDIIGVVKEVGELSSITSKATGKIVCVYIVLVDFVALTCRFEDPEERANDCRSLRLLCPADAVGEAGRTVRYCGPARHRLQRRESRRLPRSVFQ